MPRRPHVLISNPDQWRGEVYSLRLLGVVVFLASLLYTSLKLAPIYTAFIIVGVVVSGASMICGAYLIRRRAKPIWLVAPYIILTQGFLKASSRFMPERVFDTYWIYYLIQWIAVWALLLLTAAVVLTHIKLRR